MMNASTQTAEPTPHSALSRKVLTYLSAKPTDARGYAAMQLAGHTVDDIDEAIGALHHEGLVNAFFIARTARPRYHPSSLTREGRRVIDQPSRP